MDFFVIVILLLLAAFVAFLFLADSDLSLFLVEKFGKKLGELLDLNLFLAYRANAECFRVRCFMLLIALSH